METATNETAPTTRSSNTVFSVVKNWIADLSVSWRSTTQTEPATTKATANQTATRQQAEWSELSGPRLSAGRTSGRSNFAHKVVEVAQREIAEGRGPVTLRTNDPRVKQILRDIDSSSGSNRIANDAGGTPLSVRRKLRLDAKQSPDSVGKRSLAVLRRQLEDIEAALQMGEKVVINLESPMIARNNEVQAQLKRLLRTREYTADRKLLLRVEGNNQDAVWEALGTGFISAKQKREKAATGTSQTTIPARTVSRPAIDRTLQALDQKLQTKLRDITSEAAPSAVRLTIRDLESFKYAEKHIRRLQKLYGTELLQVNVASGYLKEQIEEYRASQNQRVDRRRQRTHPVETTELVPRQPPAKPKQASGEPVRNDPDSEFAYV